MGGRPVASNSRWCRYRCPTVTNLRLGGNVKEHLRRAGHLGTDDSNRRALRERRQHAHHPGGHADIHAAGNHRLLGFPAALGVENLEFPAHASGKCRRARRSPPPRYPRCRAGRPRASSFGLRLHTEADEDRERRGSGNYHRVLLSRSQTLQHSLDPFGGKLRRSSVVGRAIRNWLLPSTGVCQLRIAGPTTLLRRSVNRTDRGYAAASVSATGERDENHHCRDARGPHQPRCAGAGRNHEARGRPARHLGYLGGGNRRARRHFPEAWAGSSKFSTPRAAGKPSRR